MATINDIYTALINVIVPVVYPDGEANPSIINAAVKIRPGWPNPRELDTDLAAGECYISIFNLPRAKKNTSRFRTVWQKISNATPTLTLTVNNGARTVTVGGSVTAGENAAVTVNGSLYVYTVSAMDTLDEIATNLAALIPSASVLANVITIADAYKISGLVGTPCLTVKELKRQEGIFQIDIWTPTFDKRVLLADAIELTLAELDYLSIPDDINARIIYADDHPLDELQKVAIYRHCFLYRIEYATTLKKETSSLVGYDETIQSVYHSEA